MKPLAPRLDSRGKLIRDFPLTRRQRTRHRDQSMLHLGRSLWFLGVNAARFDVWPVDVTTMFACVFPGGASDLAVEQWRHRRIVSQETWTGR